MSAKSLSISLYSNMHDPKGGSPVIPTRDSFIGSFVSGDAITMHIEIGINPEVTQLLVTSNRERHDVAKLSPKDIGGKQVYVHTVPIIHTGKSFDEPDNDRNCVHLVKMGNDGFVHVENLLIISQDADFYLIRQITFHDIQVVRGHNGEISVPELGQQAGFRDLMPIVEHYYRGRPDIHLVAHEDFRYPNRSPDLSRLLDDNHLMVKWWSARNGSGTGLGVRRDGEYVKLWWRNMDIPDRHPRFLCEGEMIRVKGYSEVPPTRGRRGGRLEIQAIGITRPEFEEAVALS